MPMPARVRRTLAYVALLLVMLAAWFAWQQQVPPAGTGPTDPADLPLPGQRLQGKATVFDADTLGIHGQRLRLEGVDAPEFEQTCGAPGREWPCGQAAIEVLRKRVHGRDIDCSIVGIDRYQRGLARCSVDGEDLNRWLVRNGWAVRFGDDYLLEEIAAETGRLGLWRDDFERPSQWRRARQVPE